MSLRRESQGGQLRSNRQHKTVKTKKAKKSTARMIYGTINVAICAFRAA